MNRIFFNLIFYTGIIFICLIFLPSFFLPQNIVIFGGKLMGYWSKFCLKNFLSTNIIIKGKENLIKNEKFFVACTHQSAFETYFLQTLYNGPIFILKKELLKIPIFGWYLKKIGSISIDRNKITKDNLGFIDRIKKTATKSNRPLIIFPQGTRVDVNDRTPFKKGASRIYDELKIKCQPVVMNSGNIWPKHGSLKRNKSLTVSILKPIETEIDSKNFLEILEKSIYNELDKLD